MDQKAGVQSSSEQRKLTKDDVERLQREANGLPLDVAMAASKKLKDAVKAGEGAFESASLFHYTVWLLSTFPL